MPGEKQIPLPGILENPSQLTRDSETRIFPLSEGKEQGVPSASLRFARSHRLPLARLPFGRSGTHYIERKCAYEYHKALHFGSPHSAGTRGD